MSETEKNELMPTQGETALAPQQGGYVPTMWNDTKMLATAYKAAQYLASSDLVPEQTYKNKPNNCLIALDISNRMNISPLLCMQNLYIVRGKPAWSGSFCAAAINGCGKFTPIEYIFSEDNGGACFVRTTRLSDGKVIEGSPVSIQMARDEGWLSKSGSKWQTMPRQMMQYRAAAFFARTYCPEVLLGLQTVEEVKDVAGYDDAEKNTVKIVLD